MHQGGFDRLSYCCWCGVIWMRHLWHDKCLESSQVFLQVFLPAIESFGRRRYLKGLEVCQSGKLTITLTTRIGFFFCKRMDPELDHQFLSRRDLQKYLRRRASESIGRQDIPPAAFNAGVNQHHARRMERSSGETSPIEPFISPTDYADHEDSGTANSHFRATALIIAKETFNFCAAPLLFPFLWTTKPSWIQSFSAVISHIPMSDSHCEKKNVRGLGPHVILYRGFSILGFVQTIGAVVFTRRRGTRLRRSVLKNIFTVRDSCEWSPRGTTTPFDPSTTKPILIHRC